MESLLTKIHNREQLIACGDGPSRQVVLDIAEKVLSRLDAYRRISGLLSLDGHELRVGTRTWDLRAKRNVYLLGAGKACNAMALAVDHALGDRLTHGIAIVKTAEATDDFHHTEVHVGGHPLPNAAGHEATRRALELVDAADKDDLFIAVVSGGSSALMNVPVEGISVEDEIQATDVLLRTGASIYEINAIRRHISQVNGGRLAQRVAARGSELIGIAISDAVGNPPTSDITIPYDRYASTPIGPDPTTLDDARRIMQTYGLRDRLPSTVVTFLDDAGPEHETPKAFPDNTYFLINTVADSCRYAAEASAARGLNVHVLTSSLEGESSEAGRFFASVARETHTFDRPFQPPALVVSAGETVTTIPDSDLIEGTGGPSHELTAAFAIAASTVPGACMFSIDSEGTDGTTPAAGGITDSTSLARATAAGVDLKAALRGHATHEALTAIGDVVMTGNTGTNVCDINLLYVSG